MVVAISLFGTFMILRHVNAPQQQKVEAQEQLPETQEPLELTETDKRSAAEKLSTDAETKIKEGKTEAAIKDFKEAEKLFSEIGDLDKASSMSLKVVELKIEKDHTPTPKPADAGTNN